MSVQKTEGFEKDIKKGSDCLIRVMDKQMLVKIVDVGDDSFRVSFSGVNYPVDGMFVELDFHDHDGVRSYRSEVVQGPKKKNDGIVLSKHVELTLKQHRDSCRVPTDLMVQVRDQIHVRRYNAFLLNLSTGGVLIQVDAPFDLDTTVELTISLPGEAQYMVLGQILHVSKAFENLGNGAHLYGLRFIGVDPLVQECISRYCCKRLQELYLEA